jgi:excisionase family DNA binding protein
VSAARAAALRAQADALVAHARALRDEADALDKEGASAIAAPVVLYATVDEAAHTFGVSRRTIFEWVRSGCPSIKRGAVRRIPIEQARAWLNAKAAG